MSKNEIFVIGSWANTKAKEKVLKEKIISIKEKGYPICLVSHYPICSEIQELVNYYIFEKENVLSIDWRITFWRIRNGIREEKPSLVDYHSVACLMNIRNAVDFLLSKTRYKTMHFVEYDLDYDFDLYIDIFNEYNIPIEFCALFIEYEKKGYRTDLFSCELQWYQSTIPKVESWDDYKSFARSSELILEFWFAEIVKNNACKIIKDFLVNNKWSQAQYINWDDNRKALDFSDAPQVLHLCEHRNPSFTKVLKCLYDQKIEGPIIVEIGVTRNPGNISDGDSTSIWAWYINKYGGSYHGCDINANNVNICLQVLKNMFDNNSSSHVGAVTLTTSDGIDFLKNFETCVIDLLYLDTIDWKSGSHESGLYHLQLLLEAIDKVNIGGYVMFDDTFDIETYAGKAEIAIPYLLGHPRFTCVHRGYQFIFRKDY
mgnify:CR=1 FL=1